MEKGFGIQVSNCLYAQLFCNTCRLLYRWSSMLSGIVVTEFNISKFEQKRNHTRESQESSKISPFGVQTSETRSKVLASMSQYVPSHTTMMKYMIPDSKNVLTSEAKICSPLRYRSHNLQLLSFVRRVFVIIKWTAFGHP